MKYRKLGKTDLKISVIGLGTDQFSGEWAKKFNQDEVNTIIERAHKLGINFIDTAECYGDHLSESLIGNAIHRNREEWIIATKFGHRFHSHLNRTSEFSPTSVIQQLEESMRALNTDYIDIYQFHSGNNEEFNQHELWSLLNEKVKEGTIRHLGISILNSLVISNDISQIKKASEVNVETIQVVYNRLNRKAEEFVLPLCQKQNLGVIVRIPLAKGHLTGKYNPDVTFPKNDKRYADDREQTINQLKLVQDIKQKEVPSNMNMTQWALAWCLNHPSVSVVIPGCKDVIQLESNAATADLDLVDNDHNLSWH
ncbi:MAG: aldo/keto reductase [Nitrososphaera sp.]|jgi:aryl-alcohol dehydrogenase-like predicted oxidoreductase